MYAFIFEVYILTPVLLIVCTTIASYSLITVAETRQSETGNAEFIIWSDTVFFTSSSSSKT